MEDSTPYKYVGPDGELRKHGKTDKSSVLSVGFRPRKRPLERKLRATPLFRAVDRRKGSVTLSDRRLSRHRAREAVERRAFRAGDEGVISSGYIGCHSLQATGITAYLEHPDARVEVAQYLAGHARTETTGLYNRREEQVSLDEVERIGI